MNIAIVGLGLLGGSFAKSISNRTNNRVYAISHNQKSIDMAIKDKAIIKGISNIDLKDMDVTIVCLPPSLTINFLRENAKNMRAGSIVSDICGVKREVMDSVQDIYTRYRVDYISIHPMAGRECSGYINSIENMFDDRSVIYIENENARKESYNTIHTLMKSIGFTKEVTTTKEDHDRIIAYTSQMCHITSNAFVKSPTSREHVGFSGGSFEDLTRVAFLDPNIWIELFSMNRDMLLNELNTYIDELRKYQNALINKDYSSLYALLKEGRDIKEYIS